MLLCFGRLLPRAFRGQKFATAGREPINIELGGAGGATCKQAISCVLGQLVIGIDAWIGCELLSAFCLFMPRSAPRKTMMQVRVQTTAHRNDFRSHFGATSESNLGV